MPRDLTLLYRLMAYTRLPSPTTRRPKGPERAGRTEDDYGQLLRRPGEIPPRQQRLREAANPPVPVRPPGQFTPNLSPTLSPVHGGPADGGFPSRGPANGGPPNTGTGNGSAGTGGLPNGGPAHGGPNGEVPDGDYGPGRQYGLPNGRRIPGRADGFYPQPPGPTGEARGRHQALPRHRPPRTLSTATGDGRRRLPARRHRVLRLQGARPQAVPRVVRRDTEALLGRQGFPGLPDSPRCTITKLPQIRALTLQTAASTQQRTQSQEPRESKDRMEDPVRMRPPELMEDPVPMGHPGRTEYLARREPQDRTQVPDRMQQAGLRDPWGRTRPRAP